MMSPIIYKEKGQRRSIHFSLLKMQEQAERHREHGRKNMEEFWQSLSRRGRISTSLWRWVAWRTQKSFFAFRLVSSQCKELTGRVNSSSYKSIAFSDEKRCSCIHSSASFSLDAIFLRFYLQNRYTSHCRRSTYVTDSQNLSLVCHRLLAQLGIVNKRWARNKKIKPRYVREKTLHYWVHLKLCCAVLIYFASEITRLSVRAEAQPRRSTIFKKNKEWHSYCRQGKLYSRRLMKLW